ncbi:hypothetical protein ACFV1N_25610 [Streptosporangium canum]|uniref:hypothetical protein n=1 Tax=Streptosporangium canum TaxID=324952 RepID=UPI0036D15B4B
MTFRKARNLMLLPEQVWILTDPVSGRSFLSDQYVLIELGHLGEEEGAPALHGRHGTLDAHGAFTVDGHLDPAAADRLAAEITAEDWTATDGWSTAEFTTVCVGPNRLAATGDGQILTANAKLANRLIAMSTKTKRYLLQARTGCSTGTARIILTRPGMTAGSAIGFYKLVAPDENGLIGTLVPSLHAFTRSQPQSRWAT